MLTRRAFIRQAGTVASIAIGASAVGGRGASFGMTSAGLDLGASLPQAPQRYRIGLQLFTLNAAMNRDPVTTLQHVAAMGYEEVETYGFNPAALSYYRMPAAEFAARLRDLDLPAPSGHYDLQRLLTASPDEMNRYVDRCAEGARLLGQRYITWPYLEPATRSLDAYRRVAAWLNTIGERLKPAGLFTAYHNGGGEFVPQNGQTGYDIILRETDPALVKLQLDIYWHSHDTTAPVHGLFERAPGRFDMWHVKDMHKVSRDYTELGAGTIDYTRIWPDTTLSGMKHFFVEQGGNFAIDAMQSAADGMAYVKRHLQP